MSMMLKQLGKAHTHHAEVGTINPDGAKRRFKGETTIVQPSAPAAPSITSSISDYIANYPALFALQKQYAPQEAQMQLDLATQYAGQLGAANKAAQDAMYPGETAITNKLNEQVLSGIGSEVPAWQQQQYRSDLNAQLGENAMSGVGADYVSRGMAQQKQDWQNYYRNLGLSITNRQPVYSAGQTQTNNVLGNYTPQGVMNYNSSNYGTAANIYGTQAGMYNNARNNSLTSNGQMMNLFGSGIGAMGTMGGGFLSTL